MTPLHLQIGRVEEHAAKPASVPLRGARRAARVQDWNDPRTLWWPMAVILSRARHRPGRTRGLWWMLDNERAG